MQRAINVISPAHSAAIQTRLFELGYKWMLSQQTVAHTTREVLWVNDSNIDAMTLHEQNVFDQAIVIKFDNYNLISPKHLARTIWRYVPKLEEI